MQAEHTRAGGNGALKRSGSGAWCRNAAFANVACNRRSRGIGIIAGFPAIANLGRCARDRFPSARRSLA
eukprot:851884-Pleurochrysis_carterae.AAC.1